MLALCFSLVLLLAPVPAIRAVSPDEAALAAALAELLPLTRGEAEGGLRVSAFERRGEREQLRFEAAFAAGSRGAWSLEVLVDGRRAHLHVDPQQGAALEVGTAGRAIAGWDAEAVGSTSSALALLGLLDAAGERWPALANTRKLVAAATPQGAIALLRTLADLEHAPEEPRAFRLRLGAERWRLRLAHDADRLRELAREDGSERYEFAPARHARWAPSAEERLERVARAEMEGTLRRAFLRAAELMHEEQKALPPADEIRRHGAGELRIAGGSRTLLLAGSPEAMGAAHGALLAPAVRANIDATLGVVGLVYTVERERWFLGEIRAAWRRLEPYLQPRHLAELDGIADGAGLPREEVRLANVFPELFHCSGFALSGGATASGEMLHGRVLDYMTEIGLQRSAVLLVQAPDDALAFANVGYAGFAGSVTGANERGLSIGEMGGRGEGDWDGEPMAYLLRRALEEAQDLETALSLYKEAARTCEYFYVLAHGPTRRAAGLAAWPARLEILAPGVAHELLPHAIPDAVLLSAGGRYEELVRRVRAGFGHFDPARALRLMDPGVAMGSNLHKALFAPARGELWVAHAPLRGGGPAAREPYVRVDLERLFEELRAWEGSR